MTLKVYDLLTGEWVWYASAALACVLVLMALLNGGK
jgi:hypothetical protein